MHKHFKVPFLLLAACLAFASQMFCAEANNPPPPITGLIEIPERMGLSTLAHDRSVQGTATVTPSSEAANCTIESSTNLKVSDVVRNGGTITFKVTPQQRSFNELDADVTLRHSSRGVLSIDRGSVVVPFKIGTPHPTFNGPVTPTRQLVDSGSSPSVPGVQPPACLGIVRAGTTLTITVLDQFSRLCGDIYGGSLVTEGDIILNVTLSSGSTYGDPVGQAVHDATFANRDSPLAQAWLAGNVPANNPASGDTGPLNIPVEVDGISLFEAIVGRRTILSVIGNTYTLQVIWP